MNDIFTSASYPQDMITLFIIFLMSALTTISGISGAALLVPLFVFVNKFDTGTAIPLSIATIFGNVVVRIIYFNYKHNNHIHFKSMLYYSPTLIIVPLIIGTSFIGVILQEVIPKLITASLIIISLALTFCRVLINGIEFSKLENLTTANLFMINNDEANNFDIEIDGLPVIITNTKNIIKGALFELDEIKFNMDGLSKRNSFTNKNFLVIMALLLLVSFIAIFTYNMTQYNYCEPVFIGLILVQIFVVLLIVLVTYFFIIHKIKSGNNLNENIFTAKKNIFIMTIISGITGILATYTGIGGASIIVPFLMHMDFPPDIIVSTGSIITLFTVLVSTMNYTITGNLLWEHALVYNIPGIIGTICGIVILKYITKKQQSYIIFTLVTVIFIAMMFLIYSTVSGETGQLIDITMFNFCR